MSDDGLDFDDFATATTDIMEPQLVSHQRRIRLKGGSGSTSSCSRSSAEDVMTFSQLSNASSNNNNNSTQSSNSSSKGSPTKRPLSNCTGGSESLTIGSNSSSSLALDNGSISSSNNSCSPTVSDRSNLALKNNDNSRTSTAATTIPAVATAALDLEASVGGSTLLVPIMGRTKTQRLRRRRLRDEHHQAAVGHGEPSSPAAEFSRGSSIQPSSSQEESPPAAGSSSFAQRRCHVRFSLDDATSSVAPSSQSSSVVSSKRRPGGGRPPLAKGRAAKKSKCDTDGWLDKMICSAAENNNKLLSSVPENPPVATRSGSATCLPPQRSKKKSATMDVCSVQDAGNFQLLSDECTFLCSTVQSSSSSKGAVVHALAAASDLVYMLSSKQNRRTLFGRNIRAIGSSSGDTDDPSSPLQAVLGVFAWAKTLVDNAQQQAQQHNQREELDTTSVVMPSSASAHGRTKAARKRQHEEGTDGKTGAMVKNSNVASSPIGSVALSTSSVAGKIEIATTRQQLLDAIGMCLYFVSLDCTLSDEAASSGSSGASKAARRMRKAILTNCECLEGILYMVLADPMTQRLRAGEAPTRTAKPRGAIDGRFMGMSPLPSVQFTNRKSGDDDVTSIASTPTHSLASPSSTVAGTTPDSQSSSGSNVDPTVAGRRRKLKRRRLDQQQQHAALRTITETDGNNDMEFPGLAGSAGIGKDDDKLSFASESPLQRKPFIGTVNTKEGDADDDLNSVALSTESHMVKARDQLDQVTARILDSIQAMDKRGAIKSGTAAPHCCGKTDQNTYLISSYVPLVAITRIVSGKYEGSDKSCIDDDNDDDDHGREGENGRGAEHNDDDVYNPLLETNRLLGENGAIPRLSQALAETLTAVTHQYQLERQQQQGGDDNDERHHRKCCQGCLAAVQDRVSMLVSLVDGAALLSESNRQLFCEEGFTSEAGGFLIIGLIAVLRNLLQGDGGRFLFDGFWGEITLATLRMLTSLTHENNTAAKELEGAVALAEGPSNVKRSRDAYNCGLDVVAEVLRQAVRAARKQQQRSNNVAAQAADGKLIYDSVIFCLNILANVVESSGGSCSRALSDMTIPGYDGEHNNNNLLFLTWMTRWLVGESHSFREAVTDCTFGTSPSKHQDRTLDAQEDEKLVTAGNGFVLLSCLLVADDKTGIDDGGAANGDDSASSAAYNIILKELPGNDRDAKIAYLKNTLKAFCNFYHYSIGDLSVAIVAPVKLLLKRLESIQEQRRRFSLLGC